MTRPVEQTSTRDHVRRVAETQLSLGAEVCHRAFVVVRACHEKPAMGTGIESLHRTRLANSCCALQVLAELKFDIPLMYAFHREQSKDVHVDLWRFTVTHVD